MYETQCVHCVIVICLKSQSLSCWQLLLFSDLLSRSWYRARHTNWCVKWTKNNIEWTVYRQMSAYQHAFLSRRVSGIQPNSRVL